MEEQLIFRLYSVKVSGHENGHLAKNHPYTTRKSMCASELGKYYCFLYSKSPISISISVGT